MPIWLTSSPGGHKARDCRMGGNQRLRGGQVAKSILPLSLQRQNGSASLLHTLLLALTHRGNPSRYCSDGCTTTASVASQQTGLHGIGQQLSGRRTYGSAWHGLVRRRWARARIACGLRAPHRTATAPKEWACREPRRASQVITTTSSRLLMEQAPQGMKARKFYGRGWELGSVAAKPKPL